MNDLEPPFYMEALLPPFAYLDRAIDKEIVNSPIWGMAWAVMYMELHLQIPAYVRLCIEFSAIRGGLELRRFLDDWNGLIQQESGDKLGAAYADILDVMVKSLGPEDVDRQQISQRKGILCSGVEILRERWHETEPTTPSSFVER